MNHPAKNSVEVEVLTRLCDGVGTPLAHDLKDMVLSRKSEQLDLSLDPKVYLSAFSFANDYLLVNFLRKWKGHQFGIDTRANAISAWSGAEQKCEQTNRIWKDVWDPVKVYPGPVGRAIVRAQHKIASILGPFDLRSNLLSSRFTSGATSTLSRRNAQLDRKMTTPLAVTPLALQYLRPLVESNPPWVSSFIGRYPDGPCSLLQAYEIVDSSRFLTVPKTAKTDRPISAEPTGNLFLQRGLGRVVRDRLARWGVDLRSQERNQQLAKRAYLDRLATLDLESASDTVSYEVVRLLLPDAWFEYFDHLRTPFVVKDGEKIALNKFSAMGNGYTFELETLIFYAVAFGVCEELGVPTIDVSAYGDDLICPQDASLLLIEALEALGFIVNRKKSFLAGDFFESCGMQYFRGHQVNPVFQKNIASNDLAERIRLYNRLVRWAESMGGLFIPATKYAIRYLRSTFGISKETISSGKLPGIPYGSEGDDGFLVDKVWISRFCPNRGYRCRVWRYRDRLRHSRAEEALLAYKMHNFPYQNPGPDGSAKVPAGKGAYERGWRWVSVSSLTEGQKVAFTRTDDLYEDQHFAFVD